MELVERLEDRRPEIEQAILTRVYAVSAPGDLDPAYVDGLRTAVSTAIDYGLAAIELGEERSSPPPPILLTQARVAARTGVSLDTVLRRYFAGHALLGDFLVEEVERSGLQGAAMQGLLRAQATLLDRLLAAISEEHARETGECSGSSEQRRAERIERLLAGELVDASGLAYDFEGHHLGAVASGETAEEVVRQLAGCLDRRLLVVPRDKGLVWAWFGGRRRLDLETIKRAMRTTGSSGVSLAFGEPGVGLTGWRLTHHQARAALPIALRTPSTSIRYADVALLASILRDELLVTSLQQLYLEPLAAERDGGTVACETLRAYFAAERNTSSAAAALGISRQAVAKRLLAVENRLGCSLGACGMELEAVLRLEEPQGPDGSRPSVSSAANN